MYNNFNEMAKANMIAEPNCKSQMLAFNGEACQLGSDVSVRNQPWHSFSEGTGGIDFHTEFYARDGVVPSKEAQNKIAHAMSHNPFYGELPAGFSGFGERTGEILVCDGNGMRICDKSDVSGLSGYVKLPEKWMDVAKLIT